MCASIQQRGYDLRYLCQNLSNSQEKPHFLSVSKGILDIQVLNQLHGQIYLTGQLAAWLRSPEGKQSIQCRLQEAQEMLNQMNEQQERLKAEQADLFEHYAEDFLSRKSYSEAAEALRAKLRQTSEQMESAAHSLKAITTAASRSSPWLTLFANMPYPKEMTAEIVQQTIARILIRTEEDAEVIFFHQESFQALWEIYQQEQS